ncbi:MAG: hypothetical protein KDA96_03270 [Planctomycetaceae bacterium]|nr:hypothetical protein [Planctomycetaceae bacterium]
MHTDLRFQEFARHLRLFWLLLVLMVWNSSVVSGQVRRPVPGSPVASEPTYALDIEILVQPFPVYGLKSQEWGRELQKSRYIPRFRDARPGERLVIENVDRNSKRVVHVVGGMDRDGNISIGDQTYELQNAEQLIARFDELAKWGAGGRPTDRPQWGLSAEQLEQIVSQLSAAVETPIPASSPVAAVDSLKLPERIRVTWTDAAREHLQTLKPVADAGEIEMNGLSTGTSLAIALAQFGLGFRPLVMPAGDVELQVDVGNEHSNLWPVGWTTKEPLGDVAPTYFRGTDVGELKDVALTGLFQIAAERLQLPHYYSEYELQAGGIDVQKLTYSRKAGRVSMFRLLTYAGAQFRLGIDLRVDEAGHGFLWVTTHDESLAFRKRFARPVD